MPTNWNRKYQAHAFTPGTGAGVLPPVHPCASLRKGLISDTLPRYIATHRHHHEHQHQQHPQQQQQQASSPLLGVSIDVDLYEPSVEILTLLHQARMLRQGALIHFHELVHPFGPGDHRLARAVQQSKVAAQSGRGGAATHPFNKMMLGITQSIARGTRNASFFWSHEQRALFDFLRAAPGTLCWMVPMVTDGSPESALFVLVATGGSGRRLSVALQPSERRIGRSTQELDSGGQVADSRAAPTSAAASLATPPTPSSAVSDALGPSLRGSALLDAVGACGTHGLANIDSCLALRAYRRYLERVAPLLRAVRPEYLAALRALPPIPKLLHACWRDRNVVDESRAPIIIHGLRRMKTLNPEYTLKVSRLCRGVRRSSLPFAHHCGVL